jgi:DNA repair protein RecO (recombination protein O)
MTVPRIYRTEAIVLKSYDYGEADRILTLCTAQTGKLRAIAKGVRRTKSRKAGHLDHLTRSNLLLARGRNLDIITQADTIETFRPMRDDLWRSSHGHYVAELVDSFSVENLANYPVYALCVSTLRRLATAPDLDMVTRAFELQLLGFTGYRPQLHRCVACDTSIEPVPNRFSSRLGGVLCPACSAADSAAPEISVPALKAMRNLQTNEAIMLHIGALDEGVRGEIERHLREYITYRLESRPRSAAFLDRLRREGVAPTPVATG